MEEQRRRLLRATQAADNDVGMPAQDDIVPGCTIS